MAMGMLFFFSFLVLAVNIMFNLYATSAVSALALDAARDAAERDGDVGTAQAEFNNGSGTSGATLSMVRDEGAGVVRATLVFETNALLPAVANSAAFGVVNRTFEVRIEEQQD